MCTYPKSTALPESHSMDSTSLILNKWQKDNHVSLQRFAPFLSPPPSHLHSVFPHGWPSLPMSQRMGGCAAAWQAVRGKQERRVHVVTGTGWQRAEGEGWGLTEEPEGEAERLETETDRSSFFHLSADCHKSAGNSEGRQEGKPTEPAGAHNPKKSDSFGKKQHPTWKKCNSITDSLRGNKRSRGYSQRRLLRGHKIHHQAFPVVFKLYLCQLWAKTTELWEGLIA